jgi:excinuclease ABC subunit A
LVPTYTLTIRERAIGALRTEWRDQDLRNLLGTFGYDVDRPWRDWSKRARDWTLFTEDHPTVPMHADLRPQQRQAELPRKAEPGYPCSFTWGR